jgi:hypothetical protein
MEDAADGRVVLAKRFAFDMATFAARFVAPLAG